MGSNVGERGAYLAAALDALEQLSHGIRASSIYESEPVGYADQPLFWNMAAAIRWSGEPEALLETLQRIERRVGRRRRFRNGPREIDIDILDFAGLVRASPDPVLPHPELSSRRFALAPLAEIAPRWRHPVTGLTAREMMRALPAKPGARPIGRLHDRGLRTAD
ncbi:MAG TPA: 2-amino-4-hydroxy-6-hydroxymethyldihydropteridine diphosphokinase [Thermoanaerobaculia bacterium]|nr:2-amino-4-hydroxy-6-hydroxymethyldihydropteridine diphosphokinase [Thermoanaerobaculia bacterium]